MSALEQNRGRATRLQRDRGIADRVALDPADDAQQKGRLVEVGREENVGKLSQLVAHPVASGRVRELATATRGKDRIDDHRQPRALPDRLGDGAYRGKGRE